MKDTTLEGRAKTKNGVTRLVFSVVCILLEVIFVLLLFTGLNRYAEAINLCTRILGLIVILNMYASPVTSTIKMPWIFLIMVFPIMGLTLYLMVGLNGGTNKMRKRYKDSGKITAYNPKSGKYFFIYTEKCFLSCISEYGCNLL